jgi:RNA polymerase sigma-70 factor (ECF subfamily)
VNYQAISPEELVLACGQPGNEPAWTEFVRRFQPLIAGVVFRVARRWGEGTPQVVDDLVQETYLKLCVERLSVLKKFESTHKDAIYGYIKVFAANLASDHFKRLHAKKRGGGTAVASEDDIGSGRSPSNLNAAVLERAILLRQVDTCLRAVASGPGCERDRRIFWLYYRVGLPASEIAALSTIGLSTKGVESTILRLTRQVRERLMVSPNEATDSDAREKGIRPAESF